MATSMLPVLRLPHNVRSANTGRWSLAKTPSSDSTGSTLYASTVLEIRSHNHQYHRGSDGRRLGTHQPKLLPPNTKSIRAQLAVFAGVVKPVKVAKLLDTRCGGACPRRSSIVKPGSWSAPTAKRSAKVALIATGGAAPVMMLYAPASEPVGGL